MTQQKPYRYHYRAEFDNDEYHARFHFPIWKRERCISGREDRDDWTSVRALFADFENWCESTGTPPITREWFLRMCTAHGFVIHRGMIGRLVLTADAWALEPR